MRERDFDAVVRAHARTVSAYARALCRDPWRAEEAVQETFLRAWKSQGSFAGTGSFEGWLLRICRNCVIDLAHRDRAVGRLRDEPEPIEETDSRPELFASLATLPIAQREVIVLCGVLGFDYEAAAALLEVPVGTVRSRLHRARTALARALQAEEATG